MKELYREHWKLEFDIKGFFFTKKLSFRYRTGTIEETLELSNWIKEEGDLEDFLFQFLNRHGKITKRQFSKISPEKKLLAFEYIKKTYGKGIFDKEPTSGAKEAPDSSMFAFVEENGSETIESMLNMTWGQFHFLIEGIIWNLNEKSEEGKKKNKEKMFNTQNTKEMIEASLKRMRERRDRIKWKKV